MSLLLVNLYEFGQFLRILLWISVPMMVIAMLVTTWLHYRRKQKTAENITLSMEGLDLSADPAVLIAAMNRRLVLAEGSVSPKAEPVPAGPVGTAVSAGVTDTEKPFTRQDPTRQDLPPQDLPPQDLPPQDLPPQDLSPQDKDNMYRGILWMKEKYEQYRDMADQRIGQLKDALARAEKKYQDLLDLPSGGPTDVHLQQQYAVAQHQLEEKDRTIDALQSQLQMQWQKAEELVVKLQTSSQLLLNISQELDKANNISARF